MVLHGGKQSFIKGIGQYSQGLFDKMWSEHMLSRVLQTPHDFLNFRIKACHFTQLWQMMSIAKLQILITIGLHLD